jgi:hypothetical protein
MPTSKFNLANNGFNLLLPQGDSKLLEFGDTTKLQEYDDGGYRWLQEQGLDCPCLIKHVGHDNLFLVEVVQVSRKKTKGLNTPTRKEISVARIVKKKGKSVLERLTLLYFSTFEDYNEKIHSCLHGKLFPFVPIDNEYLVAYPFVPSKVEDCLPLDNSVLCSQDRFMPVPVNLEEGTLLGRLDDRIQSIDAQELRQILNGDDDTYLKLTDKELEHVFKDIRAVILSNLTALRKTISLRTRRVDLVGVESSVEAPFFRAKPSDRPKSPRPGTFFFNKGNGKFEGFNGNDWVTLGAE